MHEEWKPVVGFEGYYEVSNFGQVRSVDRIIRREGPRAAKEIRRKGRVLKGKISNRGYHSVNLNKEGEETFRLTHHLVAEAFIGFAPGPIGSKNEEYGIDHLDGHPLNNRADNLEWVLNSINRARREARCLKVFDGYERDKKLSRADEDAIRALAKTERFTPSQISKMFSVQVAIILAILAQP